MPAQQRLTILKDVASGADILNRTNAGGFTAIFTVGGTQRQAGVLVRGLAGAETAAVEMLATNQRDETDAQAGDWMPVLVDGVAVRFTATDNLRSFLVPGIYRLNCSAAAGQITAGVYY
jgi:uncharacterized membrane protein